MSTRRRVVTSLSLAVIRAAKEGGIPRGMVLRAPRAGLLCHLSLDPDECVRVTETRLPPRAGL